MRRRRIPGLSIVIVLFLTAFWSVPSLALIGRPLPKDHPLYKAMVHLTVKHGSRMGGDERYGKCNGVVVDHPKFPKGSTVFVLTSGHCLAPDDMILKALDPKTGASKRDFFNFGNGIEYTIGKDYSKFGDKAKHFVLNPFPDSIFSVSMVSERASFTAYWGSVTGSFFPFSFATDRAIGSVHPFNQQYWGSVEGTIGLISEFFDIGIVGFDRDTIDPKDYLALEVDEDSSFTPDDLLMGYGPTDTTPFGTSLNYINFPRYKIDSQGVMYTDPPVMSRNTRSGDSGSPVISPPAMVGGAYRVKGIFSGVVGNRYLAQSIARVSDWMIESAKIICSRLHGG